MSDQILASDDEQNKENANIAIKAAQGLREYAMTKDKRTEGELIELLNQRPSLMQRFFPTAGHRAGQQITIDRLRQLADDRREISRIHHESYRNSLMIIANVQISELEMKGKSYLAKKYNEIATETQKAILDAQEKHDLDLLDRTRRARADFAGEPEFLERALKKIDIVANTNMLSTEKLVSEVFKTLDEKIK